MKTHYKTLKLDPGASIEEVKASYRRLAKQFHPDTTPRSTDTARKFHEIHEAYRSIINEISMQNSHITNMVWPEFQHARYSRPITMEEKHQYQEPNDKQAWRFEGVTERGADMVYVIRVSETAAMMGTCLVLPWKAEDACPACLGRGQAFTPIFGGPNQYKSSCSKCGGKGVIRFNSTVHFDLSPDMVLQGVVRMKGLGRYQPSRAVRGDLVIEILVDYEGSNRAAGMFSA